MNYVKKIWKSEKIDSIADMFFIIFFFMYIAVFFAVPHYFYFDPVADVNNIKNYNVYCGENGLGAKLIINSRECYINPVPHKPYISVAFPLLYWFLVNLLPLGLLLVAIHLRRGIDFPKIKGWINKLFPD
jgi:hypothetical protein